MRPYNKIFFFIRYTTYHHVNAVYENTGFSILRIQIRIQTEVQILPHKAPASDIQLQLNFFLRLFLEALHLFRIQAWQIINRMDAEPP